MMRAGLWTGFFLEEKRECTLAHLLDNIERLRKSGFECAEMDERNAYALFVLPDQNTADRNAETLSSLKFFSQLHSPKPLYDVREQMLCEDRILRACSIMNIQTVVMHPFIAVTPDEEPKAASAALLTRYVEKADRYKIRVALENQIYSVDIDYYLRTISGLYVNIDFAHAIAAGNDIVSFIDRYGDRLAGLHVSDSDGRHEDYHIMPGKGIVDWKRALEKIKKTLYDGDFHLEIVNERSSDLEVNNRTAKLAFDTVSAILAENMG